MAGENVNLDDCVDSDVSSENCESCESSESRIGVV